jgi:hypothetical protein
MRRDDGSASAEQAISQGTVMDKRVKSGGVRGVRTSCLGYAITFGEVAVLYVGGSTVGEGRRASGLSVASLSGKDKGRGARRVGCNSLADALDHQGVRQESV